MVILRSQNKINDFLMILAWASPFNNYRRCDLQTECTRYKKGSKFSNQRCASIWQKLDVISLRSKKKINLIDASRTHSQRQLAD